MGTEYTVPDNAFSTVRVVAPPDNMGLMHRWIANQEMCSLMGGSMASSIDPTNHYRCSYSGWGKVATNHYDMEHDMLIDRNELACNYTNQCGTGGNQPCLGSEFGVISPAAADR